MSLTGSYYNTCDIYLWQKTGANRGTPTFDWVKAYFNIPCRFDPITNYHGNAGVGTAIGSDENIKIFRGLLFMDIGPVLTADSIRFSVFHNNELIGIFFADSAPIAPGFFGPSHYEISVYSYVGKNSVGGYNG